MIIVAFHYTTFLVIPQREVQAKVLEDEMRADGGIRVTAWLISGLQIQETQ
jgi:hypothetical protein